MFQERFSRSMEEVSKVKHPMVTRRSLLQRLWIFARGARASFELIESRQLHSFTASPSCTVRKICDAVVLRHLMSADMVPWTSSPPTGFWKISGFQQAGMMLSPCWVSTSQHQKH